MCTNTEWMIPHADIPILLYMLYACTGHQSELRNHYGLISRFPYKKYRNAAQYSSFWDKSATRSLKRCWSKMGEKYHVPYHFLHPQNKEMEAWKWQKWMIHKAENAARQSLHLRKVRPPVCNYLNPRGRLQGSVMDASPFCNTGEKLAAIWYQWAAEGARRLPSASRTHSSTPDEPSGGRTSRMRTSLCKAHL